MGFKMTIKILSTDLINKIAAGEVIERPASIIKECLENSVDANANKITITLKKSGKEEIIISDNGEGISKDDLELTTKKHATSKISTVDDLFKIHTLGFRGEALASISSISRFTIQSKTKEQETGYEFPENKKVAMETGTNIIVKNIFYNTPARLRYLKSDYIELTHIIEIVEKYSLCYPKIKFKLMNDNKTILQSSNLEDELTNITTIINKPFTQHLLKIENKNQSFEIKGFISEPGYLPKNSNYIMFFLNNRYIKNKLIQDALIDAYKTMLFLEEKPAAILHLNMNPEQFDVNIHPKKLDVKFENEQDLYQFILLSVKETIENYNQSKREEIKKQVQTRIFSDQTDTKTIHKPVKANELYSVKQKTNESQNILKEEEYKPSYRVLDIIDNTYIVLKSNESLYIIDQHALHERVLFETILKEFEKNTNTQKLLTPVIIDLTSETISKLERIKEKLKNFEFEYFGTNSIKLTKVPTAFIDILDKKNFFKNLLDDLNFEDISKDTNHKLATKACKAAIKAHDTLTTPQLNKLLDYMFKTQIMLTCPHGRPFFIELNKKELEKRFKR